MFLNNFLLNIMNISHYKKNQCSPFVDEKLPYSCLSPNALNTIVVAVNKLDKGTINLDKSDKQKYESVCKFIKSNYNCNTEGCWLGIKELMKLIPSNHLDNFENHFRPVLPKELIKDKTNWLSNFDIEAVLYKHHNNLDDFYFYGALPIDFRKCSVSDDLCKINILSHRKNGEKKIGFVFNTDESNKPGQHWFSMYIDLDGINFDGQPGIYYFDSFGSPPTNEITELINKIKNQDKECEYVVLHNDKSIQKNTYSCGVYTMHFLEHMLQGRPFKQYLNNVNDKKVKQFLNECYLHPNEIKY